MSKVENAIDAIANMNLSSGDIKELVKTLMEENLNGNEISQVLFDVMDDDRKITQLVAKHDYNNYESIFMTMLSTYVSLDTQRVSELIFENRKFDVICSYILDFANDNHLIDSILDKVETSTMGMIKEYVEYNK